MSSNQFLLDVLSAQNLTDDGPEMIALRARKQEVQRVLEKEFSGCAFTIRYGGSKAKGTLIAESFDLDLVFYVHSGEDGAGATLAEIYSNVAAVLGRHYRLREKTSAIRLLDCAPQTLGQDFHIDVVPGRFTDDTEADCYIFQKDREKGRLKTNLDEHIRYVSMSGLTEPVRLLKLWRVRRGVDLKQFAWELIALDVLKQQRVSGLADQTQAVLDSVANSHSPIIALDPANPAGNDLSDVISVSWPDLRVAAQQTLAQLRDHGWSAVFPTSVPESDRLPRVAIAAASSSSRTKPWTP